MFYFKIDFSDRQNIAATERWFEINISSMGIETQEPVSLLHLFLVILKVQPILVSPTDTANENRNMTDFTYVKGDLSGLKDCQRMTGKTQISWYFWTSSSIDLTLFHSVLCWFPLIWKCFTKEYVQSDCFFS